MIECKYSYQLGDLCYKNIDSKIHILEFENGEIKLKSLSYIFRI